MADDMIYRQAAIRWVKTECNPYGKPTIDFESGKKFIEYLEQMPSAEPKRKMGHWIVRNEYSMRPILCSECGEWQSSRSKFCPECGARMDLKGD